MLATPILLGASLLAGCGDDDMPAAGRDAGSTVDAGPRTDGGGGGRDAAMPDASTMPDGGALDGSTPDPDGAIPDPDGALPDGALPDGGPGGGLGTCAQPNAVTLTLGSQQIMGDTTALPSNETLTGCGQGGAPQEVVQVTLPASDMPLAVEISLATTGTDPGFDTVVQVRSPTCASAMDAFCIDDGANDPAEFRSVGGFTAAGGDQVFLIVSGFSGEPMEADFGPWVMDVTVSEAPEAPELTELVATRSGLDFTLALVGSDADVNAATARVEFLDEMGMPIGIDTDGDETPDLFEFDLPFDQAPTAEDFVATVSLNLLQLPDFIPAESVRVRLLDRTRLESATLVASVTAPVAVGEACLVDANCLESSVCDTGTCALSPEAAAVCGAATQVNASPAMVVSESGSLEPGTGALGALCSDTEGTEVVYEVVVPAGSHDLVLSTENAGTGALDTVVYAAATCGGEVLVCNDDIDPMTPVTTSRAIVNDAGGSTFFAVVEAYQGVGATTPFQLDVSLRPVLGTGDACDPAEVMNRCASGPWPAGGTPVCP